MSSPAGTLITTYNANFIPPRFMPSYTGHLPTMKLDYAETYGKHGVKYFQDFRSRALETSKNNISRGGYFPSIHTSGADPAVASRTRLWDRWLQTPQYRLHNEDHDRREGLVDFCKLSRAHREHFCDKTGTVPKVEHFQLPAPVEDAFQKDVKFAHLAFRYTDDISIPFWDHQPQLVHHVRHTSLHRPTTKERAMRDLYFENRRKYM